MQHKPNMTAWGRTVILLAGALFAAVTFSSAPAGLQLAVRDGNVKFEAKAAFIKIAFDFGQSCSKANSCGSLAA